jgi:very-short-patch-repair endonuclease
MRSGRSGTKIARALRSDATDAERHLWWGLRSKQFGWIFRRQRPVPPDIADFACVAARLIVEMDGGQHAQSDDDARRDDFLRRQGWRVMRFWNNDVLRNRDGVLHEIAAALPPTPALPRRRGREERVARRVGAKGADGA